MFLVYLAASAALLWAFGDDSAAPDGSSGPGPVTTGPLAGATKRHDGTFLFPDAPNVVFCSYVKAGNVYMDAATGNVISEAEATSRAQREGCTKL